MLRTLWWQLIRFGFRLLYNELAWTYDVVSWVVSLGEWRAWQRAALPYVTGPRVLEIAHGPGHMLLALAEAGHRVVGVDLSPAMGRQAQRRLHRAGLWLPLIRGRVQAMPFASASFDSVLSTFPTEFIAQPATMQAVQRVLRPGGRLVIVPEGHLTGRGPLARFITWLYTITGQRRDAFAVDEEAFWPAHSPRWIAFRNAMSDAGFHLQIEHVRLRRSAATVVIAHKRQDAE